MTDTQIYQIFEALPLPGMVLAADAPRFTVLNANDAYVALTGVDRESFINKGFFETFPENPIIRSQLWNYLIHNVVETGQANQTPVFKWQVSGEGGERFLQITNTPVFIEGNEKVSYIVRTITDVTRTTEVSRQFESIVQTIDGIIWEFDAETGRFLFVSEQIGRILGYSPQQCIDDPDFWQNRMHPDDRFSLPALYDEFLAGSGKHTFDYRMFRADGSLVWLRDVVAVIRNAGESMLLRGITSDITESRRIESIERIERELLELVTVQDGSMQSILSRYLLGIEAIFPQMRASIVGIKNNRLHTWASPSLPMDYMQYIENLEVGPTTGSCGSAAYHRQQVIVSDIEHDVRWAGHADMALSHNLRACWSSPIILSNGEVVATFAFYYDQVRSPQPEELQMVERAVAILKLVFENKINSEYARDASMLMSQGQELARFGTWEWNIASGSFVWSDTLYVIYGLNKDFKPTLNRYIELIAPEDRERVCADIWNMVNTKGELQFEERIRHSSGEERYLKTWCKCMLDEQGMPVRVLGACLDITDSRKISEELQASESRLRSLVDSLTNYVIRTDHSGNYTYVNNKFAEDFEWFYKGRSFLGVNSIYCVQPYSRFSITETLKKCLNEPGTVFAVELDHVKDGGTVRSVYWHFIALTDSRGEPTEVQCIGIDVSEEKRAFDALRRSNERYELLNKVTNDAIYDWDMARDHIEWGEGFKRLFGFDADEDFPLERWIQGVHPNDRERVEHELTAMLADKKAQKWAFAYQFQRADGRYAFVEDIGYVRRNRLGRATRMIGVLRDITRQKEEEYGLKLLSSVITNTNDAVLIAASEDSDLEGLKTLYVNGAFTHITGMASSQIVGQNPMVLKGFDHELNDFTPLYDAITQVQPAKMDALRYIRNNEMLYINISIHPVTDERGQLTHWISIGRDVTERRKYINEVEERNKKLQDIAWMQSHVLRAPVARVLGLLDLLRNYPSTVEEVEEYLQHMHTSALELDDVIRQISSKTESI